MNTIMKNSLAYGLIGFIALTACANKKKAISSIDPVKTETKTEAPTSKTTVTPKDNVNGLLSPVEIDKDRTACEQPWGSDEEESGNKQKFGYFVEALTYGTPPHGGIAWGLDRLVMILAGTDAIRDVIAYPKTAKAQCLMSETPSNVDSHQLLELGVSLIKPAGQ